MSEACPHCGAPLPGARDAFCPDCRNPLDELSITHPAPTIPSQSQGPKATATARGAVVTVALTVMLFLAGVMILTDAILRAFVQRLRPDQLATLASGLLCLMGGSYFWRSRRPRRPPTDQPRPEGGGGGETRATFRDPFAAYNAGSNIEAHLVCGLLQGADIPAVVVEDVSQAGVWLGGTVAEIHKPQVWIERAAIERARVVLITYERRNAERRAAEHGERAAGPMIGVVCEECGKRADFPEAQRGAVQRCPHCGAYVDVGDEVGFEGWDEAAGADEA